MVGDFLSAQLPPSAAAFSAASFSSCAFLTGQPPQWGQSLVESSYASCWNLSDSVMALVAAARSATAMIEKRMVSILGCRLLTLIVNVLFLIIALQLSLPNHPNLNQN